MWCHNLANHGENEVMAPEGDKMGLDRPRGPASGAATEILPSQNTGKTAGYRAKKSASEDRTGALTM